MSANGTMRVLGGDDVDALINAGLAFEAARAAAVAVAANEVVTGRVQVNSGASWMRILAGMISSLDLLGYKEFHRVGTHVRYHVHLFRESTGEPLGIVDGRRVTSLRTAATAAVAAEHWIAGRGDVRLGIVGSGEEAREGLRALTGALQVTDARVYSPTRAHREAFAREMSTETGCAVVPVPSVAAALDAVEIAYIATSSQESPFLTMEHTQDIGLLLAIGSTRPEHRELEGSVFVGAALVVVDTPDALHEAGDSIAATESGFDPSTALLLGQYLETVPAIATAHVLFKSIGSVEQDLVLAHHLLAEAERVGAGYSIDSVASLRVMR
ncbi:MAG: ornithine cyclodeaminase [Candidatus Dormibacteraeota bacterium]|nr:ornithine cyclodeaminase [Candidatus Dormibacteraeota bacterium]